MNAALLGGLTAICWGGADFIARFSGRALGHYSALLGVLVAGSIGLTIYALVIGMPVIWNLSDTWLLALSGITVMLATLLLYEALARGPVSVVAPIAGSYPAFSMLVAVAMGVRPEPQDWIAIAIVMAGVFTVARYAGGSEPTHNDPAYNRRTILIALSAALVFSMVVLTGQESAIVFGELQTTLFGRIIGVAVLIPIIFFRKDASFNLPIRWWPLIALQAALDSTAYVSLFAAGHYPNSVYAAVTASTFGAVTVLLARVFLKENITLPQWAGVIAIFAGAAALSA